MARRRFFVDQVVDGQAEMSGDDAHHLARVLRVLTGQKFEITDSRSVWLATVTEVRKSVVRFSVDEELESGGGLPEVTLYLALIKFDRFEWAVEKATELGVTRIVPVDAARTEQGLLQGATKRVERWRRLAKEASEQSRRLRAPQIDDPLKFAVAVRQPANHRIWLDEKPGAPALVRALHLQAGDVTAFAVGPEGGWSDPERSQFAEQGWTGASLGSSVLRAETAVCAALAVFAQLALTLPLQSS
jgi:16S rRNA (uracil1498-N3)-methyltransferase